LSGGLGAVAEQTVARHGKARAAQQRGPSDTHGFSRYDRDDAPRATGRRRLLPPPVVDRAMGMRSIRVPPTIESEDPYAWMGARPGRRAVTPTTTELHGPSAWPAKHAKRREFAEMREQRYTCWRAETLGNVSQWGDGPGVYNLTNPTEPKGAQIPYITDMRGGRRLFPARSVSSILFAGPVEYARGNPRLFAEQQISASFEIEPPPRVAHPLPCGYGAHNEALSRLELT